MEPLVTLFREPKAGGELPPDLSRLYDGGLQLDPGSLSANVVTSIDGVAGLEHRRGSGSDISGRNAADRFVMGLLRALADAVITGAGTLRSEGGQRWSAAQLGPPEAGGYRSLATTDPLLVVVTAQGEIDPAEPALGEGALVLTSDAAAATLRRRLPAKCDVRSLGTPPLLGKTIKQAVLDQGCRRLLTEGGPHLLGSLVADGALDQLFLTVAPVLAGRLADADRLGLLEGLALPPGSFAQARLHTVKASGSYLFLRYGLNQPA
ncbi:MAG: dihydrofolate reductase family protein [Candidatus Dormibacteraeota bacterium]|nr:dihydrofolate reductase family protein [Candidatus Dormibacteraeota bacterium]